MLENSSVRKWFDYTDNPSEMGDELTTELPEFPGVTFTYNTSQIIASKPFDNSELTGHVIMIGGMPIWNAYFTDLTGDGYPEICATYSWGSGMIDNRVVISDYTNGASYELSDRGNYDFVLRYNETDGHLYVDKTKYNTDELVESGRLAFEDNCIQIIPIDNSSTEEKWDLIPMVMVDGTLYLDTGKSNGDLLTSDIIDGEITSEVDGNEEPTQNDQSNFGTGYYYRYGEEGTVDVLMNGKWWIYATE